MSPIYHYLSQPEVTEAEASARFADMLHYTDCPGYIVHMTCEGALNAVRKATQRNQKDICRNLYAVFSVGRVFI